METQKNMDDQIFSFPEFEFGSSPNSSFNNLSEKNNSPADHLFFNGRLLPHVFPIQHAKINGNYVATRSSSVNSSSKDSWISCSPSNSINSSRSSSCSSARNSSSDNSERKLIYNTNKIPIKISKTVQEQRKNYNQANKNVLLNAYGSSSSKRWQFIAHSPTLTSNFSRKKVGFVQVRAKNNDNLKIKKEVKEKKENKPGFGWRFLRSFWFACRECHAMAPSMREDVLQTITKL